MHKEYKRIVPGSSKALLLIHGIVGTPNHFAPFMPFVRESMSVYNLLLDGHGKGVRDFAKTSMEKWESQVALAVEELAKEHREIYIAAHSLGCLLAIEQAVRNPKITKLFLLAVPLKLFLKPKLFVNSLKVYLGKIDPENEELMQAVRCYGIAQDKNIFRYLGWVPRFLELFSKISKTRKIVGALSVPCIACQSTGDEMVSVSTSKMLQANKMISVLELPHSGHYYYEKHDLSVLTDAFRAFVEN